MEELHAPARKNFLRSATALTTATSSRIHNFKIFLCNRFTGDFKRNATKMRLHAATLKGNTQSQNNSWASGTSESATLSRNYAIFSLYNILTSCERRRALNRQLSLGNGRGGGSWSRIEDRLDKRIVTTIKHTRINNSKNNKYIE